MQFSISKLREREKERKKRDGKKKKSILKTSSQLTISFFNFSKLMKEFQFYANSFIIHLKLIKIKTDFFFYLRTIYHSNYQINI